MAEKNAEQMQELSPEELEAMADQLLAERGTRRSRGDGG